MNKGFIFLLLVLFTGAVLRFFKLGEVPSGITLDEMGYIFNAYSISQTGKNVFGEFIPFLTWMVPNGFPFMPVPIYLSAPVFWVLNLSSFSGRLMPALLGVIDIYLLYILVNQIFKNKSLAFLSAFFLAISPWHLHFARSAYDQNYSLFFYLLGIVLFVHEITKKRLPVFSVLSFLLAVFSYRGMSIIAIPLFILLFWYGKQVLKAKARQMTFFVLGCLFVVFLLIFVSAKYGDSYTAEGKAIFTNSNLEKDVKNRIDEAEGPLLLRRFFLNKPTFVLDKLRENYLKGYSPDFLFLYTEPSQIYSIWSRGRIYFLDAVFIVLGFFFLFSRFKKEALFAVFLFLISGLPGGVGGFPYSARNFFMSLILPILTASGVLFLYNLKAFRNYKKILIALLVFIYGYLLSSYLFDYYLRYPKIGGEVWGKSFKDLSYKILQNKDRFDKIIIGPTTHGDFVEFAFYSKLKAEDVQSVWLKSSKRHTGPFNFQNIYFVPECLKTQKENTLFVGESFRTLFITPSNCRNEKPTDTIKDSFGNDVWRIYK